jgi:peptide/nickel transport system permease protein
MTTEREPRPRDAADDRVARASYWMLVWHELQKNKAAIGGLGCIVVLFVVAVCAPLISLNQPLFWSAGDGPAFPFFSALFNRLLFESSVDIFFNLILVLGPAYVVAYFVARRHFGAQFPEKRARVVAAIVGAHVVVFALVAPETHFGAKNPLRSSARVVDYRTEAATRETQGKKPSALFPLRRYGYRETNPAHGVEPPSSEHWLGTDTEGRDVFARMLYGTRISLTIGVVAVAIYVTIGVVLGALAGYFGGWVDIVVSRFIEVMICFPSFFLILTLAALIQERSIFHVMVIIGITSWTGVARLIRAEFLKHKNLDYAQAALALGIPKGSIIFQHILPNAIAPVLVSATFGVASAILIESSLSFLGLGDIAVASWGETLNTGRLENKLWLILAPGFAIFAVVTLFNVVGEGLRDALDPKLKS